MSSYIGQKLWALLWVLGGISVIVFLVLRLTPGDPALILLGPIATQEDVDRLRAELGLNAPLYVQYAVWLGHVLRGDLGTSITMHRPVLGEVFLKLRATALLTGAALLFSTAVGVTAGVLAGWKRNSAIDRVSMVLASTVVAGRGLRFRRFAQAPAAEPAAGELGVASPAWKGRSPLIAPRVDGRRPAPAHPGRDRFR